MLTNILFYFIFVFFVFIINTNEKSYMIFWWHKSLTRLFSQLKIGSKFYGVQDKIFRSQSLKVHSSMILSAVVG